MFQLLSMFDTFSLPLSTALIQGASLPSFLPSSFSLSLPPSFPPSWGIQSRASCMLGKYLSTAVFLNELISDIAYFGENHPLELA
jgi:hypothetical protein